MHARVARLRGDLLHRVTTELARGYTSVTVEDLNAAGMLTNRRLARVVSDAAFGEFRRQLTYKAAWYDTDLTLPDRIYACGTCGLVLDRDVNAAINLARGRWSREAGVDPEMGHPVSQ